MPNPPARGRSGPIVLHGSLTRIADLDRRPFEVTPLARDAWSNGDYVVVEVLDDAPAVQLELPTGRLVEIGRGDLVVGAFGRRHATLEATGSWEEVGDNGEMEILTGGGLLGRLTSRSALVPPLPRVAYRGHAVRAGTPLRMKDFAIGGAPGAARAGSSGTDAPLPPVILVIGTSMSAGKTATARVLIRRLVGRGLRVMGMKVAGAGRYRDILTMADCGADPVLDFVDAGLPSTVCPAEEYAPALDRLLVRLAAAAAGTEGDPVDVAVVEVGASPLEPYNGERAIERLRPSICLTALCASDPYAVVGIMQAFGVRPDFVTGIATNTIAGVELVRKLARVPAFDVRAPDARPELDALLTRTLGLDDAR